MSAKTDLRINFLGVDMTAGTIRKIGAGLKKMAMVSAAAVAAAGAATFGLVKNLHQIGDTARKAGVDAETYQRLGFALGQVGLTAEDAGTYLMFMKKNIGMKSDMSGNIFERMGVDVAALKQLNPEQQFFEISKSIARLGNETDRTQALTEIFGRKGAGLGPLLRAGPKEFEKGLRDVMGMIAVTSTDAVNMASDMDDAFAGVGTDMKASFADAFLAIANSGKESFGRVDVAIFALYQKSKLFVMNVIDLFGWLKDATKAIFTETTFADMESLTDRYVKNIEQVDKAVQDYKAGIESKDNLAQQLKNAAGAGDGLRAKVLGAKRAIESLAQIGLSGTYEMIKAQYGRLAPAVGGVRGGIGGMGAAANNPLMNKMVNALNIIADNTGDTADGIGDLEEI
jgi:hypothetical protein